MARAPFYGSVDLCIVATSEFSTVLSTLKKVTGSSVTCSCDCFKRDTNDFALCIRYVKWAKYFDDQTHGPLRIAVVCPTDEGREGITALLSNIAQTKLRPAIIAMTGACSASGDRAAQLGDLLVPFRVAVNSGKRLEGGGRLPDATYVELDSSLKIVVDNEIKSGRTDWLRYLPDELRCSPNPLFVRSEILLVVANGKATLSDICDELRCKHSTWPSNSTQSDVIGIAVDALESKGLVSSDETGVTLTEKGKVSTHCTTQGRQKVSPSLHKEGVLSGDLEDEDTDFDAIRKAQGQDSLIGYEKRGGYALFHNVQSSFRTAKAIFVNGIADFGTKSSQMLYYRDYCTASATAFICFLLEAHLAHFQDLFLSVRVNESVDEHVSAPRAGHDRGVEKSQGNNQVIQKASEKRELFSLSEKDVYSASSSLLREWPSLMRLLHVEEPVIEEIKRDYRQGSRRQCDRALNTWIKSLPRNIQNAATFMLKKQLKVLGIFIPLIDCLQCDETNEADLLHEYEQSRLTSRGFFQAQKATVALNTYDFNRLDQLVRALELNEAAAGRAMIENENDIVEQAAAIITIWEKRQSAALKINSVFQNLLQKENLESLLHPFSSQSHESSRRKLVEGYLSFICEKYKNVEYFNFEGIDGAPKQLPLENVYVPLRLESSWQDSPNPCYYSGSQVPRDVEKASEMVFSDTDVSSVSRIPYNYIVQRRLTDSKIEAADTQKDQPATVVFKKYPALVILGDPGSGKTIWFSG